MKLRVNLPDEDVEFLDDYVAKHGAGSRSDALHRAVGLLRALELQRSYEAAWDEWERSGQADEWESALRLHLSLSLEARPAAD